jgi:integrase
VRLSRIAATAAGRRDEALIVTALKTGMRQGELAALRWEGPDDDPSRRWMAG